MNYEFHYYINYIIALQSGFDAITSYKIAYSSQYIDDNKTKYTIFKPFSNKKYINNISTSYDILRNDLYAILASFHFIPGNTAYVGINRVDGLEHPLAVTPDSYFTRKILLFALRSNNPYLIGIASHAYADSWAHQNYTGSNTTFNSSNFFRLLPSIGHMNAMHKPDILSQEWLDLRLKKPEIDNRERFFQAACTMLKHYKAFNNTTHSDKEFLQQLYNIFYNWKAVKKRIQEYNKLAIDISKTNITRYHENEWFNEAILMDPLYSSRKKYYWLSEKFYTKTHWYQFQEAVKEYKKFTWNLIKERFVAVEKN